MKRHWVLALAALAVLPRLASAQVIDNSWGPRFHVTPFIGVSPGFSQTGYASIITASGLDATRYRFEYASSLPLGVNVEYRFFNRFGAMLGGMWSRRTNGTLLDIDGDNAYAVAGDKFWMIKGALALHLRETNPEMQLRRLNAALIAGPVFIKDQARQDIFTPNLATNTVDEWGVVLGAEAELPTAAPRLAFIAGVENVIIFWNNTKYGRRVEGYLTRDNPNSAVIIDANRSNMTTFRVGLSYRF